jgi:dienelactone hydrolase
LSARQDVRIQSAGDNLAGWLYRPDEPNGAVPCIVMAHGFGALKEARLDAFAERFAAAGYAVVVFDYRHFGGSTGEPRNLVDISRQHEDWRAAIQYARSLEGVDPDRVVIWGSSFSGGHVMKLGAEDERIAAIISQVPHADGLATLRAAGPIRLLKLTAVGLRDAAVAAVGREPYYIPIVGPPGSLAAMATPDAEPGYSRMYADGFEWRNEVPARIALRITTYSPGRRATQIAAPMLVLVAGDDVVTPPGPARRAAAKAPKGKLVEFEGIGHFDPYVGANFERSISAQLDFLQTVVPAA